MHQIYKGQCYHSCKTHYRQINKYFSYWYWYLYHAKDKQAAILKLFKEEPRKYGGTGLDFLYHAS
jgi:hypothetical protein